jgi:hypothetical protein
MQYNSQIIGQNQPHINPIKLDNLINA